MVPATVRSALLLKRKTPLLVRFPTKPPVDVNSKVPVLLIVVMPALACKLPENVLVPPKVSIFVPSLVKS